MWKVFSGMIGKCILHLTIRQSIAACQLQVVGRTVEHTQRAATHQVNIVGVVGIHVGHDVCTFRHVQRHIHAEAVDWRARDGSLRGITEVRKLDQIVQLVVSGDRRVTEDVAHIRCTQHIQTSTHIDIVQRTVHHGKDIDKGLAIGHTLGMLLDTDNLEVISLHAQINHNLDQDC